MTREVRLLDVEPWVRESNLIEGVDDPLEDQRCQKAWIWLLRQKFRKFSIIELHRQIMWKQARKIAGKLRNVDVRVGMSRKPGWRDVPKLLDAWLDKWKNPTTAEEIKQAHIEFENVHPFCGGNGRVGRHIMNWQRIQIGLEPLLLLSVERQNYYSWFENNDDLIDSFVELGEAT